MFDLSTHWAGGDRLMSCVWACWSVLGEPSGAPQRLPDEELLLLSENLQDFPNDLGDEVVGGST